MRFALQWSARAVVTAMVLAVAAAMGCGRIGYDSHASRDGGTGRDGEAALADGAGRDAPFVLADGSTGLVIDEVKPRWATTAGGETDVYLEGDLREVAVTIDGAPCAPVAPIGPGGILRCFAPPHSPAVVEVRATNAAADDVRYERAFTYITSGFYQYGGPLDDRTSGIDVDERGNVYVSGATTGSLGASGAGDFDALLVKYSSAGELLWTRQVGTAGFDYARDVVASPGGDVVIVGYGAGDLAADGDWSGGNDMFVARFSASGEALWVHQYGTPGDDQAWDIGVDGSGAVVVSGWTDGSFAGMSNAGGLDYVILRITAAGTLEWARQVGTAADDQGHSVGVNWDGVSYLVGYTRGALDGANAGGQDLFIARYDPDGARAWIRQRGTTADDRAQDATVAPDGAPWLAGITGGALDGQPSAGGDDLFVMRYSTTGMHEMTRQFGSPGTEDTYGLQVDWNRSAYIACSTTGAFGGETSFGMTDGCVVSVAVDGAHRFTRMFGTPGEDGPSSCAIDYDATNLLYVSLITDGRIGPMVFGGNDVAVGKLDFDGTFW